MLFALTFLFWVTVCYGLQANQMFPYGPDIDQTAAVNDDGYTSTDIDISFPFFNHTYNTIWVETNGILTFSGQFPTFTPATFPLRSHVKMVATFWADVDTRRNNGRVYYRSVSSGSLLATASSQIKQYFPQMATFRARWLFIATWHDVTFFGGSSTTPTSTFQCVLVTDGQHSFAIYNYLHITWTTGTASDGDAQTGLGGTPAQVGFDAGDGVNFFAIPQSRTAAVVNVDHLSNLNPALPGKYIFRINNAHIDNTPVVHMKTCRAITDPHFTTFDGMYYSPQQPTNGRYLAAAPVQKPANTTFDWSVNFYTTPWYHSSRYTAINTVEVVLNDQVIRIGMEGHLLVNGIRTVAPWYYPNAANHSASVVSYGIKGHLLSTSDMLRVTFTGDTRYTMTIEVPLETYGGQLHGACGNLDGSRTNDGNCPTPGVDIDQCWNWPATTTQFATSATNGQSSTTGGGLTEVTGHTGESTGVTGGGPTGVTGGGPTGVTGGGPTGVTGGGPTGVTGGGPTGVTGGGPTGVTGGGPTGVTGGGPTGVTGGGPTGVTGGGPTGVTGGPTGVTGGPTGVTGGPTGVTGGGPTGVTGGGPTGVTGGGPTGVTGGGPTGVTGGPTGVTGGPTGVTGGPTGVTGGPTGVTGGGPTGVTGGGPTGVTGGPTGVTGGPTGVTGGPTGVTGGGPTGVTGGGPTGVTGGGPTGVTGGGPTGVTGGPTGVTGGPTGVTGGGPTGVTGGGPTGVTGGPTGVTGGPTGVTGGGPTGVTGGGPTGVTGGPTGITGGGPTGVTGGPTGVTGGGPTGVTTSSAHSEGFSTESRITTSTPTSDDPCQTPAAHAAIARQCAIIMDASGPFSSCAVNASNLATDFYNSCLMDLCAVDGEEPRCQLLQAYATACMAQMPGLHIYWRTAQLCPPSCAANEHYDACASACPATCGDPQAPVTCPLSCHGSCTCNDGFLQDNGTCIRSASCGCTDARGNYHPEGDRWVEPDCTHECMCSSTVVQCSIMQACSDHAQCTVQDGLRNCFCNTGYTGDGFDCSVLDPCRSSPCQNSATCSALSPFTFQCECPLGYGGNLCQTRTDFCQPNPCFGAATCVNGYSGYSCACPNGYDGTQCQHRIDYCISNPCFGTATCINGYTGHTCVCPIGYDGTECQHRIDHCLSNPCFGTATCINGYSGYTCVCPLGYEGTQCQHRIDHCISNPCFGTATCLNGLTGHSCACSAGFIGEDCGQFDCAGRANGDYADPAHPCAHYFYKCSNHYTYRMDCPANLYYSQNYDACLYLYQVPACYNIHK